MKLVVPLPPTDREPTASELAVLLQHVIEGTLDPSVVGEWARSFLDDAVVVGNPRVEECLNFLQLCDAELPLEFATDGPIVPGFARSDFLDHQDRVLGRFPGPRRTREVLLELYHGSTSPEWAKSWAEFWLSDSEAELEAYTRYALDRLARMPTQPKEAPSSDYFARLLAYDQTL